MRNTRWSRWVAIAAVAGMVTALVGLDTVGAQSNEPPVPDPGWGPCGEDFPGAECALVTVPLDYGDHGAGTTEVALARIRATDQAGRIGTVFINPGGPGGSGVGFALAAGEQLVANLDGRFDVVGFDPRGVGSSDPLHCFESEDELAEFFAPLPSFPYERRQYRPYFDAFSGLGRECLDDDQAVAAHMNTGNVARDLDLLRQAVGDEQLTYLGFSYGSYLGNTYANLFPDKVRALVVDGVLDPRLSSSGRQIESDRVATQEEFEEFLRLCDEAGPDCAFSSDQGSTRRWNALVRSVRRNPVTFPDGSVYTYDLLITDAAVAMYAPETWGGPEGFGAFFDVVADAVLGDQAAAAEAAAVRRSLVERLTPPSFEADYDNGFDAYYGNQCADTEYPSTFEAFKAGDAYAKEGSRFGPFWWWGNAVCAAWPVNDGRYTGPWTAATSAPVLVVGNYFDGVTDYAGARASAELLPNSRLLSYAGWGHTAYGRSACTTEYIDAYLVDLTLPAPGTVCPANPNPFMPSAARAAAPDMLPIGLPESWLLRS